MLLFLFIFLLTFFILFVLYFRKDRIALKGPKLHWLMGNALDIISNKDRLYHYFKDNVELYGKTYSLNMPLLPPIIFSIDPINVEHVLKTNFNNYCKGKIFNEVLGELLGNGIFNIDGNDWKLQRSISSHLFTRNTLVTYMMDVFNDTIDILLNKIEVFSNSTFKGDGLNIQDMFFKFTLDSIGKIAFGTNLNCLDNYNLKFADAFDRAQMLSENRTYSPFRKFEKWIQTPVEKEINACIKILDDKAYEIINERLSLPVDEIKSKSDLVSMFITADDMDGNKLNPSKKYLRDVILNFLIAGRDTTACLLTWLFYELSQNKEVKNKLIKELDTCLDYSEITIEDVEKKLPYLRAVIDECLRLHTPVPKDIKTAINNDTLPDGTYVPAGSLFMYCPWVQGRDKSLWGEDAEKFNPERFLNKPQPSPYKYPVFQAGPRICLGKNMALLELRLVTAKFFQRFDIEYVEQKNPFTYNISATLSAKDGLWLRVYSRTF